MKNKDIQKSILNSFLTKVNKLTVGRRTKDKFYGTVTLRKAADYSKGHNSFLNRSGYGTRRFSVSGSKFIKNGSYTLGGLRKALTAAI